MIDRFGFFFFFLARAISFFAGLPLRSWIMAAMTQKINIRFQLI